MTRLEIERLSRQFGKTTAVNDVSMTIEDGDFLVLLGPSGCGKSTLLRMIAGLLPPTSGRIMVDGEEVTNKSARQRNLAMVFQNYALYPHLSVAKNLAFPLRARKTPRPEIDRRVQETAERLDISHLLDRHPKELSGGQRQRVAVGRALVRDPGAYLMDEPLSNLDAKLRTATRHELVELHQRMGATFVYVTHDQVEAMTMATRIAVLNDGHVEQIGTPEEIYNTPKTVFVAGFIGNPPTNLLDATVTSLDGNIQISGPQFSGTIRAGENPDLKVQLGIRPEHLHVGEAPEHGNAIRFETTVKAIERLGHESLIITTVGDSTVVFRSTPNAAFTPGERVILHAIADDCHLFDAESGIRLSWEEDAEVASELELSGSL